MATTKKRASKKKAKSSTKALSPKEAEKIMAVVPKRVRERLRQYW